RLGAPGAATESCRRTRAADRPAAHRSGTSATATSGHATDPGQPAAPPGRQASQVPDQGPAWSDLWRRHLSPSRRESAGHCQQDRSGGLVRHTPHYLMTDPGEVRRLIRTNPWATIVSPTSNGLVASHYPVLLEEPAAGPAEADTTSAGPAKPAPTTAADSTSVTDPSSDAISIVSHFGRPDEQLHELGEHEVLVIIQGPHDYVSASWYEPGDLISTWNHVTAHLYGIPEILSQE